MHGTKGSMTVCSAVSNFNMPPKAKQWLIDAGFTIKVRVCLTEGKREDIVEALIDTGCDGNRLDVGLADRLDLPVGSTVVHSPPQKLISNAVCRPANVRCEALGIEIQQDFLTMTRLSQPLHSGVERSARMRDDYGRGRSTDE